MRWFNNTYQHNFFHLLQCTEINKQVGGPLYQAPKTVWHLSQEDVSTLKFKENETEAWNS